MNIQPIRPPFANGNCVACCICGRMNASLADLDGTPFKAFYCEADRPTEDVCSYQGCKRPARTRVSDAEQMSWALHKGPPMHMHFEDTTRA